MRKNSWLPKIRSRQLGTSLIELMVSIALGLSVVLVILTMYQNFSGGNRASQVTQVMATNAEQAFQIIAQQMRQAGYNPPQPREGSPSINDLKIGTPPGGGAGMGIFSCARGFSNGSGASAADNIQSLACNSTATSTITYAFAVQFEADQFSPSASGNDPADCRGFAAPATSMPLTSPTSTATYYIVENRYFISNGGLGCTGNGTSGGTSFDTPSQPIVPNVESMNISFGSSVANATGTTATIVAGYLDADALGPAFGGTTTGVDANLTALSPLQRWQLVKIARVCLVMKAERRTLFEPEGGSGTVFGTYRGCDTADLIDITDGFERRAYIRHFALRNRIDTP